MLCNSREDNLIIQPNFLIAVRTRFNIILLSSNISLPIHAISFILKPYYIIRTVCEADGFNIATIIFITTDYYYY